MALAGLLALVLIGLIVALLRSNHHLPQAAAPAMMTKRDGALVVAEDSPLMSRLIVAPVRPRVQAHGLSVPATVQAEPRRTIDMQAPVTGRIVQADVRPGDTVHKGQILAEIASGDFDQAVADETKAQAQLSYADRVLHRAQGVQAVGGNATKDVDAARNDEMQAQAELERAQHRLAALNARPELARQGLVPLISPVDGMVASTTMGVGEYIGDTTTVQISLLDLSVVWVEAAVPEEAMGEVRIGETARADFDAYPGRSCRGTIFSVDPTLHADTRRMTARLACDNPDVGLKPNMFGTAVIDIPQPAEIVVPKTALLMNNDTISVFVETAPHTFRRRNVDVSYDERDDVRVVSGLQPGERVIVRGGILLNDN